jgi:hypothetical protein
MPRAYRQSGHRVIRVRKDYSRKQTPKHLLELLLFRNSYKKYIRTLQPGETLETIKTIVPSDFSEPRHTPWLGQDLTEWLSAA